jgi:xanthine dehydrogenase accessory factor
LTRARQQVEVISLARLARSMDYDVVRVVDAREQADIEAASSAIGVTVVPLGELARVARERAGQAAVVVASQGHYDEESLEAVLKAGVAYVGLVASHKRGATVRQLLRRLARQRRLAAKPGGARSARAHTARGGALDPHEIVQTQVSESRKQGQRRQLPPRRAPSIRCAA